MKRMRWLKRAAAIVLTAALCFGMTPIGNLSGIFEVRAEETGYSVTVTPSTTDIKAGDSVSLAISVTNGGESITELTDGNSMKTWLDYWNEHDDGNQDATISGETSFNPTVTLPSVGTYYLVTDVYTSDWTKLATCTTTLTVVNAGSEEGYKVTVTPSTTDVKSGDSVSLAISITNGGEQISELTDGASMKTWLDYWNEHSDGNQDATISDETSFNPTVTLPSVGTYYLVTDVYASDWTKLATCTTTLTVVNAGSEEGYKVTVTPSTTTVEAGDTVSLTAAVTYNGQAVTNLATNGLFLWWWTDSWNEHSDGKSDATYSNFDDNSGNSLTADVTVPSVGTYYIAAELKDSTNSIMKTYVTITVTEPEDEDTSDYVPADINVTKVDNLSNDFIMGMDISSVVSEFKSGVTYKDFDGNTIDNVTDFCKFLKTCGVTHVRVRIWNDPYDSNGKGYGGGNNDLATAVEIARACKAADLKMLLDFHCSDFWTDPGKQQAPKDWAGYSVEQKASALQGYLTESLTTVKATGVDIAMVQVGNETTGGFIGETDATNMCTLFSAGAAAVHNFDSNIKVVIHVTNPEKSNMTKWAATLDANSVDYDILATSYYPSWHGTFANLKSQLATVKTTYGKDVMVAETSYAFTLDETDGHENTIRQGTNDTMMCETQYPFSVQGQANYMRDLIAAVNEVGGLGVYWWESAWITVGDTTGKTGDELTERVDANKALWEAHGSGWASSYSAAYDPNDAGKWYGGSAVDNQAMFAADGSALASINVWKYVRTGAVSVHTEVESIDSATETIETDETYTLPDTIKVTYNSGAVDETVTWDAADKNAIRADKAGTYVVNGTVAFSKAVDQGTYAGQTSASVTYTLTVKAKNLIGEDRSFENGTSNFTGLDTTGKGIDGETPYDGSKCLHWYLSSAGIGSVTYKGTGSNGITLEPGAYTFEVMAQGNDGDQVTLSVLDHEKNSVISTGTATSMIGWANWVTPSVSFTITETTTVDLGITIGIQAGGWGTVDCMYLYQAETYTTHQVTFVDGDRSISKKVKSGSGATAPAWTKTGYRLGWDKSFSKVTSDLTVNAKWEALQMSIGDDTSAGGTLNATETLVNELKEKGAFTEEEVNQIAAGGSVTVYMAVNDISETVSVEDKDRVSEKLRAENFNVIGCYLDLQLIKQIGSDPAKNITELDEPIRITIVIPEDLINTVPNTTRTYAIVRVHVDEVTGETSTELIPGSFDPSTNEFTFETDRFSTYAIVYKDTVPPSTSGQTPSSGEPVSGTTPGAVAASEAVSTTLASPDTSDNQSVAPFILMMAAAFVMMGAAAFARRRKIR
ncbi:MAG: glycosyl hydrolase 53 family protein [Lachnospiraceae bacterium]|nr:glycosyl hydrolase 53 family protein [Lachnospiraceae bacterium]